MKRILALCLMLAIVAGSAVAQEFDTNEKQLADVYSGEYTGKTYSPYAERDFASRPLFGETHVHTALYSRSVLRQRSLSMGRRWQSATTFGTAPLFPGSK